ncbi:MAG: DUF4157 domain-containing protein [Ilumatobacteraceae bacterium]
MRRHVAEHDGPVSSPEASTERLQHAPVPGAELLDLQATVGNRATLGWLGAQAKLSVGAADDPLEREADQTARQVVAALRAAGRASDGSTDTTDAAAQRAPAVRRSPPRPDVGADGGELDPSTERELTAARGGGAPLDEPVRRRMEQAFGADFGAVRLHAGPQARDLNERVQASAFTIGTDIFFRSRPDATSRGGQELLAHELTHVVQQGGTAHRSLRRRDVIRRKETSRTPAKLIAAGVDVDSAIGSFHQVGHAMDIWVDIDVGKNPFFPPRARANSIYGLELEYWELINVTEDNQGGIGVKPWNDIYAMKPDAGTFRRDVTGCDMNWGTAVADAAAGTLRGKHRVGFQDVPGLIPNAGRAVKRTLQFRIVLTDGVTRKEIFATQQLEMKNGQMTYAAYRDSVNNQVETYGFGRAVYDEDHEKRRLAARDDRRRVGALAVPTMAKVLQTIPAAAQQVVQTFVVDVVAGKAAPYIDLELIEVVKSVVAPTPQRAQGQVATATNWPTLAAELAGDVPGGVGAGQFGIPNIPGTKRYEKSVAGGGVLVAVASDNDIKRLYYTDGTTKAITTGLAAVNFLPGRTFNLRSFAEIPSETIRESLGLAAARTPPKAPRASTLVGTEPAHLRAWTQRGTQIFVDVDKTIGPKIKPDDAISVFQPEVRDTSGEWIKARFKDKDGFVRASKVDGASAAAGWAAVERGSVNNPSVETIGEHFKAYFGQHGTGQGAYSALFTDFPGFRTKLDEVYGQLVPAAQLLAVKLHAETAVFAGDVTALQQLTVTHAGDPAGFIAAVMTYLQGRPGQGDDLESIYNVHIGPIGGGIPATLGELVHTGFVTQLTAGNRGTYKRLRDRYPDFQYRLNPAYREVFGQDALERRLAAIETAEADRDVPKPNARSNQRAKNALLTGGVLTANDFVPTTRVGTQKFDAVYDPATGFLDITVRVAYAWNDNTAPPGDTSEAPAAFNQGFRRGTWTDAEKDQWKRDFEPGATGPFNRAGYTISCTRPGWTDVVVTPRFKVREVPLGQQHYVVRANKAVASDEHGQLRLKGIGGSNLSSGSHAGQFTAIASLQEYDIYDKLQDPRLHTYLHEVERPNFDETHNLDRRRLGEVLGRLGRPASDTDAVGLRNLADALKRLEIPSSLAGLHPITVTATSTRSSAAGKRMAQRVAQALTNLNVPNAIEAVGIRGPAAGVVVTAKDADQAVKDRYKAQWSRFTAAHEYGHMIGLIEEYKGASSAVTVKEMISAGWLPTDTRADHLKLHPPKEASETVDQERSLAVAKRAKVETPDFAMNTTGDAPKTTSLMSGGYDVSAFHMLSAWEALVQLTRGAVDEKYWKIGK